MPLTSNVFKSTQITDLVVAPYSTTGTGSASLGNTNVRNTLLLGTETSQVVNGVTTYTDAGGDIQVLLNGVLYTLTPTQVRYLTSISKDLATALADCNAYTDQKIQQLVGLAPTTLDTLAEIAAAITANESTVATMSNTLALKANLAGPQTFTGPHTFADLTVSTINTVTATELSYVKGVTSSIQTQLTSTLAVVNNKLNASSPQVVGWLAFGNTSASLPSAVTTQGGIGWNYSGGLGEIALLSPAFSQNSLIPAFRFYKTLAGGTTTSTLLTIFNNGDISTTGAANVGALTCSSLNTIPSSKIAFLSGVTSDIQTQLGARLPTTNPIVGSGWFQLANVSGTLPTTSTAQLAWNLSGGLGEMSLVCGTAVQTSTAAAFDFRKMLTSTTTAQLFRILNSGNATLLGTLTAAGGVFTNPPTCSTNAAGSMELTNLATVNGLLANYPTSSSLATTLAAYPTTAALTTTLLDYVTNAALTTTLTPYATKTYVDTSIANLATTGSLAAYGQTAGNNAWTGSNSFSQTPTCSAAAVNATDLTTKAYVDGSFSPYSTTTQMNSAINSALIPYSTTTQMNSAISTALTPYSTTTQMNTAISTALTPYSTTTQMNSAISTATAPLAPKTSPQFSGVSYWQNAGTVFPTTANGFGALSTNHSGGHAEFDLWNTATGIQTATLDAFRFNKCTSTTAATTLFRIRNDGSAALTGALTTAGLTSTGPITVSNQQIYFDTGSTGTIFAAAGLNIGAYNSSNAYFAVANFSRQFGLRVFDEGGMARFSASIAGALTAVSGAFSGALSAASLSISGALNAASMTLTGALNAASALISGNAQVNGTLTTNEITNSATVRSNYFTVFQGLQLGSTITYYLDALTGNVRFNEMQANVVRLPLTYEGAVLGTDGRLGSRQTQAIPNTFTQGNSAACPVNHRGVYSVIANITRAKFGTNPAGLEVGLKLTINTDPAQVFTNGFIVNGGVRADMQVCGLFHINSSSMMEGYPAMVVLEAYGAATITELNGGMITCVRIG